MTEKDLLIQDLRRENETLRKELEWKEKVIELAQRHETIIHEPTKSEFKRMAVQMDYAPVVHGRWISNCVDSPAFFVCDQCNTVWYNDTKFCHNCGARMDGAE